MPVALESCGPRSVAPMTPSIGGTVVVFGTSAKYPFSRLQHAVESVIDQLPRPILIQGRGIGRISIAGVEVVEFVPREVFLQRLSGAELLVSHAGVGTVLDALGGGVRIIVMPREARFGEAADDHQLEFAEILQRDARLTVVRSAAALQEEITRGRGAATPPRSVFNFSRLSVRLRFTIDEFIASGAAPRVALAATSGGHLTELLRLRDAFDGLDCFYLVNKQIDATVCPGARTYIFSSEERDWRVGLNLRSVLRTLMTERPGVVVSTGSGSTIPAMVLGRLMGARVVYIESLTRHRTPSWTGRIAYLVCDRMFVMWPEMKRRFRRAELIHALQAFDSNAGDPATSGTSHSLRRI